MMKLSISEIVMPTVIGFTCTMLSLGIRHWAKTRSVPPIINNFPVTTDDFAQKSNKKTKILNNSLPLISEKNNKLIELNRE